MKKNKQKKQQHAITNNETLFFVSSLRTDFNKMNINVFIFASVIF